ncbi:hypothetical protein ACHAW6_006229 [Cyclotella cf. meneghiniana]
MIVLGQHVLNSYDLTENSDGENSSSVQAATDGLKSGVIHLDSPSDKTIIEGRDPLMKQWHDTRHQVSAMLGSIGAMPIASSPPMDFTWASDSDDIHATTVSSYLHATLKLAASHIPLIRAMNDALDILKTGTSLRLGLGTRNSYYSGNDGLVSRAEKAWSERRPLDPETCSDDGNRSHSCYPRLTLLRSRRILYQAMADQAYLLRSIVVFFHDNVSRAACDWNEFIDDMQYVSQLLPTQTAPALTLSNLSFWINGLRDLLYFVLSQLLADSFVVYFQKDWGGLVTLLKQASQSAKERVYFLTCAFSLSQSRVDSVTPQTPHCQSESNPNDAEIKRNASKLIHQLQSTMEAAQVSLWAFRESFTEEGKPLCDSQDPKIWWSQLKELLSQTEISMDHFEHSFLATSTSGKEEETSESAKKPSCTVNAVSMNNVTEIFVDIADRHKEDPLLNADNLATEEHSDKTLIFSGSGLHKDSQPTGKRDIRGTSAMLSTSHETFHQTMLICDLQKRLKTMQLADEHEVISLNACKDESLHSKPIYRRAAPFFLGAEGPLLTELASALSCDKDQVNLIGRETATRQHNTTVKC